MDIAQLKKQLSASKIERRDLETGSVLNQQNRKKIKVLLALITEIVARNSDQSNYLLDSHEQCEVEHILADHYDRYSDEFSSESEFVSVRNSIGDLLVLPKKFNASYGSELHDLPQLL